jgi:hypothetical protein
MRAERRVPVPRAVTRLFRRLLRTRRAFTVLLTRQVDRSL